MTSMSLQQITVPFHSAELYLVEHNGQPYTPMKPIVEGMGLDWASQFVKLKQRFAKGIVEITIPSSGGLQTMICILLRKLPAWLYSIHANKVKPELRETVIMYQNECDDVLWDYWIKGQAVNPRTTKVERTPLHDAHALLVAKTKHLSSSDAWKIINQRFGTKSINEIPYDQIPIAVEYVHHLIALYSGAERQTRNEYWTNADVQALMYYAPKFGKFVRDDLGPALSHLRSEYAAQIIGIAQEMAASANALNRLAWGWGLTHYDKLGGQPLHTMEWYLTK